MSRQRAEMAGARGAGDLLSGVVNHFDSNTLFELAFRHFVDATRSLFWYKCLATVIADIRGNVLYYNGCTILPDAAPANRTVHSILLAYGVSSAYSRS